MNQQLSVKASQFPRSNQIHCKQTRLFDFTNANLQYGYQQTSSRKKESIILRPSVIRFILDFRTKVIHEVCVLITSTTLLAYLTVKRKGTR
jgi:hypothetical protein